MGDEQMVTEAGLLTVIPEVQEPTALIEQVRLLLGQMFEALRAAGASEKEDTETERHWLLPTDGSPTFSLLTLPCVEFLQGFARGTVDSIVTDPPYPSLDTHRARGTTTRLDNWFETIPYEDFPEIFWEMYRVLKPGGHCYVMTDDDSLEVFKMCARAVGFNYLNILVWNRGRIGMGYSYRQQTEYVLFFEKPPHIRKLNDLGLSNLLDIPAVRGGYPTQKPPELFEVLISQSTQPGELVIDPFMGSASSGVAAHRLGRRYVGSDISENSYTAALDMMSEAGEYGCTLPEIQVDEVDSAAS